MTHITNEAKRQSVASREQWWFAACLPLPMASVARLPGGYHVGDAVFYTGASETRQNGARLAYGGDGEIVGPATSEYHKDNGVAVRFSANAGAVDCYITQLSRTPPPTTLPGGYRVGDTVFYAAPNETFPSGDRVLYGEEGEIVGPATLETHKDNGVAVKFSANTRAVELLSHSAQSHTSPDDTSGRLSRRRHRLLRGAEREVIQRRPAAVRRRRRDRRPGNLGDSQGQWSGRQVLGEHGRGQLLSHSAQSHTSPDDTSGRLSRRRHRLLRGAE